MRIGIIGAGAIAQTYGSRWAEAGHEVVLSARRPRRLDTLRVVSPDEAARFGDIVLLAVNYASLEEALATIAEAAQGKLVVDAINPLRYTDDGTITNVPVDDRNSATLLARKLPASRIAKAFTTLWTGHVEARASRSHPTVAMPFATNESEDQRVVEELIHDAGLVPVYLGTLHDAGPLDPPSAIWNVVLRPDELRERATA